ncbi:MAG: histidinol dehydrogenase [Pseudanabaenaceae cyanobacterium SKYGB_i_bin29]|nr:histidinol dehydrogenase [Pseudanabaenaceae cyanobacterium SKYG29]MDW8421148.1 histidinol dehydrogenase [Pseudanabaenaceae cyanobacterium SKYGB_i_bin29]
MLRIITNLPDAEAELRRIANRLFDDQMSNREATVSEIVQRVRRQGDKALLEYTAQFDGVELTPSQLRVTGAEIDAAYQQLSPELARALHLAHDRIVKFHQQRVPQSWVTFEAKNVVLGKKYTPVDRAGIYIPGGKATYPSTVLMNAVPAVVAGVKEIIMVTPPGKGNTISPTILAAAQIAGVHQIYRVGGAQAIAALAYGTETIPKVDVITGPGNIYVTLAKKQVYGVVGIDSLAGPSEVLIIADETANPLFVCADLLAQAEHDTMAAAILLTTSHRLAQQVADEVSHQLKYHSRQELLEKSIVNNSVAIVTDSLTTAVELSNLFAPEHLELAVAEPWELVQSIRHAGAIFIGHYTPEAVGDYLAGPNHTLPTSGAARYASPLGVETFMKHSSLIEFSEEALREVGEAIAVLAEVEGLTSHRDSVQWRLQ